jgi:membrane protease YdiL (CAAX protease family)
VVTTAWAALHVQYDLFEIALIWIAGLAMSAGRYSTRSLFVPMAMHAAMNAIATVEAMMLK